MKDDLGDRIKQYEDNYRIYLPNRLPLLIRLDGKGWSKLTSKCEKPFDLKLIECIDETILFLAKNIQNLKLVYTQSDEISFLIYNSSFEAEPWFGNNLQKLVSVSAGMASAYFTSISHKVFGKTIPAVFDARAFVLPFDEAVNAFVWRQQDCIRNSVQSLARSLVSHKECNNKNIGELKDLIKSKNSDWDHLPTFLQRGRCFIKKPTELIVNNSTIIRNKWTLDQNIPLFWENRNYIDDLLKD